MANDLVKAEAKQAHMLPTSFDESIRMASAIAKSGLFGCKTPEQAFALMLLADAEGLHPAAAARDYHIIDGKPSLKADAMLARYMGAGGKIEWLAREPEKVSAAFMHPSSGTLTITWDRKRAEIAGFWGKSNWKKHPIQMLSARVISEGVRASFPGVVSGVYTPEEVSDFDDTRRPPERHEPPRETAKEADYSDSTGEDKLAPMPSNQSVTPGMSASSVARMVEKDMAEGREPGLELKADREARVASESDQEFRDILEDMHRQTSVRDLKEWGAMIAKDPNTMTDEQKTKMQAAYKALGKALAEQEDRESVEYRDRAQQEADQADEYDRSMTP